MRIDELEFGDLFFPYGWSHDSAIFRLVFNSARDMIVGEQRSMASWNSLGSIIVTFWHKATLCHRNVKKGITPK